jgi:hypothetical protein
VGGEGVVDEKVEGAGEVVLMLLVVVRLTRTVGLVTCCGFFV